jgi:hypothetical protein
MLVKFLIHIHMKDVWLCILIDVFTLGVHVAYKIKIALAFCEHLKSRARSKPARENDRKLTFGYILSRIFVTGFRV